MATRNDQEESLTGFFIEDDLVLAKLVANKVTRGYQLKFSTVGGQDFYGFPVGMSKGWIQILVTEHGEEDGNVNFDNDISIIETGEDGNDQDYLVWLNVKNIEAISENRLNVYHFNPESREKIEKSQMSFKNKCRTLLSNLNNGSRNRKGN